MTSTPFGLRGPLAKIQRAEHHIRDLESAIDRFRKSSANVVGTKPDAKGKQRVYYVESVAPIDAEIPLIAGDAIQNMRSAWDYLAYGLVCDGIGGPVQPWKIEYPVADSLGDYVPLRDRKVEGARQPALDAIDATKPYKGGTEPSGNSTN